MAKTAVYSEKIGRARSPLAHAARAGDLVFVSGMPPFAPDLKVAPGDFPAQMRQCLENLKNALAAAGSSLEKVVKVNVILDRREDFEAMNAIYTEYFGDRPESWPARTTIVARLPRVDFLVEVECVAER